MKNAFWFSASFFVFSLGLAGCGKSPDGIEPGSSDQVNFQAKTGEISAQTRIFLVAGSRASAGFAQEILDQKRYWLGQGFKPDEIACDYVPPSQAEMEDPVHFKAIASELADCYFADYGLIQHHLATVQAGNPQSIYFYLTSHGSRPISQVLDMSEKQMLFSETDSLKAGQLAESSPWTNSYMIDIEGLIQGGSFYWASGYARAKRFIKAEPDHADQYLFTPSSFKKVLDQFPASTKKYVFLSACHSGGFILNEEQAGGNATLRTVPNILVMTASRSDRTSFGCSPGLNKPYFDEAFDAGLQSLKVSHYEQSVWNNFYSFIQTFVGKLEQDNKIDDQSLPQFYSNQPA